MTAREPNPSPTSSLSLPFPLPLAAPPRSVTRLTVSHASDVARRFSSHRMARLCSEPRLVPVASGSVRPRADHTHLILVQHWPPSPHSQRRALPFLRPRTSRTQRPATLLYEPRRATRAQRRPQRSRTEPPQETSQPPSDRKQHLFKRLPTARSRGSPRSAVDVALFHADTTFLCRGRD
jgi:hypothetical protein